MGLSGISPWSLVLILAIVVLLFGTKRLRGLGKDLGGAVKGFKQGLHGDDASSDKHESSSTQDNDTHKP